MKKMIEIKESGLSVLFRVRDDGVTELLNFAPDTVEQKKDWEEDPEAIYPVIELQINGTTTTNMHGYKHILSSASLDLKYKDHTLKDTEGGKEFILFLETDYGLQAEYHMVFTKNIPVVSAWTCLTNAGTEEIGLEYISSFLYRNLCGNGKKLYFDKTDLYIPYNGWSCEARWQKRAARDVNLTGMPVDGFNNPGFGSNRYCYTGHGSWTANEFLPMGFAQDTETKETYCFQIETSGQWHIEYGSDLGSKLYLALSGATGMEHGWWKNIKPGQTFATVPAAFGVVCGDISDSAGALTLHRRAVRRPNEDDEKLYVVFNDYMNCLMGDPTEEREKMCIDKAAEMGCEYYCLDAGWYDKGFWWDRVGEWLESPERFPNGLKSVFDYARSKGLKMGMWLEIEVMGTACELANKLPDDWFFCRHGKRHIDNKRYHLDFRNPDVRAYCMGVVDRLVNDYGAEYFKVDYNITTGFGSDLNSDSCADAILGHYRCLYQWYAEIFRKYPNLVIENCGSGGLRMDYGLLKLLSLQSTSDQTDVIYNSYIAANVATAVTPEQAGMWVYPYEDEPEHIIYNMVNGLLLRPYMSGMIWKMSEEGMDLMREGISLYKEIRSDVKDALPVFPLGFATLEDPVLAYGLRKEDKLYLSVFTPKTDTADIPLPEDQTVKEVRVIYPQAENCEYSVADHTLHVKMPQEKAARLFQIVFD